jgi:hypothetical protein
VDEVVLRIVEAAYEIDRAFGRSPQLDVRQTLGRRVARKPFDGSAPMCVNARLATPVLA